MSPTRVSIAFVCEAVSMQVQATLEHPKCSTNTVLKGAVDNHDIFPEYIDVPYTVS